MQLCIEPSDKALVCSTLQSLLSALQRKAPRPSALVDDTRKHTVYDKNLGRKRGNRGGVAELSPVPRVTRSKPAEPPDLVNIFRSPLASTKALSPASPRLKPDTATTISTLLTCFDARKTQRLCRRIVQGSLGREKVRQL